MRRRGRQFAALLLALCLHACPLGAARAQTPQPQTTEPAALKFDDFGDVYPTDAAARLDNFANALQERPAARGFIIVYRSHRDLPGLNNRHLSWMRNYLINSRSLPAERVVGVDGGEASCIAHEFWIVQPGATPKPREDAYPRGLKDADMARKFDEYHFTIDADQLVSYPGEFQGGLEGFAAALRKEPRALGYVIAYDGYVRTTEEEGEGRRRRTYRYVKIDPPGTAWKELRETRATLARRHGIAASRIRLVRGGYRRWRAIEFWIVPRGADAPVPTPNVFPRVRR
jgi:hypothetical protein